MVSFRTKWPHFLYITELPWDEPTFSCPEYTAWKDKDCRLFTTTPWTKIDNLALSLLRKVGFLKYLFAVKYPENTAIPHLSGRGLAGYEQNLSMDKWNLKY